jgi:hypothetical protein
MKGGSLATATASVCGADTRAGPMGMGEYLHERAQDVLELLEHDLLVLGAEQHKSAPFELLGGDRHGLGASCVTTLGGIARIRSTLGG